MATNLVRCSYQEIIDMHTESGHVTAIGIHTPTGDTPRKMFSGFFDQFKRMKYLGASISFIPVATLPADPSQVSYEAGEPGIDPRDLVNPIMFHGCHGDDLGGILNKLYGDDQEISGSMDGLDYDAEGAFGQAEADSLLRLYHKALTDKTWKKAHPQKGFKKAGLRPLVYSLASNRQIGFGQDPFDAGDLRILSGSHVDLIGGDPSSGYNPQQGAFITTQNNVRFMTPRLTSLGWIDTRNVLTSTVLGRTPQSGTAVEKLESAIADAATRQINYAELPKIFMGVILLAPAYKTELYFRVIINHYFAFKGFRGISFKPEVTGTPSMFDAYDDLFADEPMFPEVYKDYPNGFGSNSDEYAEITFKFDNQSSTSSNKALLWSATADGTFSLFINVGAGANAITTYDYPMVVKKGIYLSIQGVTMDPVQVDSSGVYVITRLADNSFTLSKEVVSLESLDESESASPMDDEEEAEANDEM